MRIKTLWDVFVLDPLLFSLSIPPFLLLLLLNEEEESLAGGMRRRRRRIYRRIPLFSVIIAIHSPAPLALPFNASLICLCSFYLYKTRAREIPFLGGGGSEIAD